MPRCIEGRKPRYVQGRRLGLDAFAVHAPFGNAAAVVLNPTVFHRLQIRQSNSPSNFDLPSRCRFRFKMREGVLRRYIEAAPTEGQLTSLQCPQTRRKNF